MYDSVAATQQGWPGIHVLLTEATVEGFDPARLQSWPNAERYAVQIGSAAVALTIPAHAIQTLGG